MRKLFGAAVLALVISLAVSSAAGASGSSPVLGYVYVNDNTVVANTIAGFARHADGTLTALAGSPFAAGGAGTGAGIASQGALQLSADGRFLVAVDAGSNQLSVLEIQADGTLQQAGAAISSNGTDPVSIAVHGGLVYVANAGSGRSNFTGFTLSSAGQLQPLAGSTVPLVDGSQPGDVLFNGDGTKLVGTLVGSSLIDSFTVGSGGLLTAAAGSPFPAQGFGPFGSEFSPANPGQLFVSEAHTATGPAPGSVSAFTDSTTGVLASIGSSPFANDGIASCWVEISHDGAYLFAVNTASSTISTYSIASNGALTFIHSTAALNGAPVGAEDARLSPDGGSLYVVEAGAAKLGSFSVSSGTVTELAGSPTSLPTGAAPAGVVVIGAKLQGSNLQGADLQGAGLQGVDLRGANLQRADGSGANFAGADLQGANVQRGTFMHASFAGASLQGANLQGDDLTGASLADANLTGANLQGANLTDATLAGATVAGANLQKVTWSNTTCPDGSNSNADGGTCQSHL